MTWRKQAREWATIRARQVRQAATEGYERAVQAGRMTARRVRALQKSAGLNAKLTSSSVRSVEIREDKTRADAAWRAGYLRAANGWPEGPQAPASPSPPDPRSGSDRHLIRADRLRPLMYAPERRASDPGRMPPGHSMRLARGDFASPQEARDAADAWRQGAGYGEYLSMGSGMGREPGQRLRDSKEPEAGQ